MGTSERLLVVIVMKEAERQREGEGEVVRQLIASTRD